MEKARTVGKTLGIVGFGRIGRSLASYALGCGMNVIAHDPFVDHGKVELTVGGQTLTVDCPLTASKMCWRTPTW